MRKQLETYFEFSHLRTNWRTEILAGATTFLTMAYIVLVNPAICRRQAFRWPPQTAATCLSAAFGCILMGIVARYPLRSPRAWDLTPTSHIPYASRCTSPGKRRWARSFFPASSSRAHGRGHSPDDSALDSARTVRAVASGIGLFIAFIGFRNAGLVVGDPETLVGLGNLRNPTTALALIGLIVMVALEIRKIRGSILIGVLATTALAWGFAFTVLHVGIPFKGMSRLRLWSGRRTWCIGRLRRAAFQALWGTAFKLDIRGAFNKGLLEIVFIFFFVDLFDNLGTLVAVTKRAGLISTTTPSRLNEFCSLMQPLPSLAHWPALDRHQLCGVDSRVMAGGRSGVTAIVTGLLFLGAIAAAPFVGFVPSAATAPALIRLARSCWPPSSRSAGPITGRRPAFLTLVLIPLTYSIANGLGFGIIAWPFFTSPPANSAARTGCSICSPPVSVRFLYLGAS